MAVDRSFAAAGVTRTITYEVNDTATMVEFIRNELAIGLLPRSLVETTDAASSSCRSAITHRSSRRQSRSRRTAASAPPRERCSKRSSATRDVAASLGPETPHLDAENL